MNTILAAAAAIGALIRTVIRALGFHKKQREDRMTFSLTLDPSTNPVYFLPEKTDDGWEIGVEVLLTAKSTRDIIVTDAISGSLKTSMFAKAPVDCSFFLGSYMPPFLVSRGNMTKASLILRAKGGIRNGDNTFALVFSTDEGKAVKKTLTLPIRLRAGK